MQKVERTGYWLKPIKVAARYEGRDIELEVRILWPENIERITKILKMTADYLLTLGILGISNFRHFKYFIGINFQMVYSGPVFQKMNTASVILSYKKPCIYDFLASCNREEI